MKRCNRSCLTASGTGSGRAFAAAPATGVKLGRICLGGRAEQIAAGLQQGGLDADPNTDIIALIAYLQRLGVDIKAEPQQTAMAGNH